MKATLLVIALIVLVPAQPFAQTADVPTQLEDLKKDNENLRHRLDRLEKMVDDVLWFNRVGDVAFIDKVRMTGPPLWKEKNPTGQGAGNPVKFWAYVFVPRGIDPARKYPPHRIPARRRARRLHHLLHPYRA